MINVNIETERQNPDTDMVEAKQVNTACDGVLCTTLTNGDGGMNIGVHMSGEFSDMSISLALQHLFRAVNANSPQAARAAMLMIISEFSDANKDVQEK